MAKPLSQMTKAELLELLAEQQAENKDLEDKLQEVSTEVAELKSEGAGWIIKTPDPTYDGFCYGVRFIDGLGWISATREYEYGKVEPTKTTTLQKYGYTPEQIAEIREREKISSAERVASMIKADFPAYEVIQHDGKDPVLIDELKKSRAAERMEAEEVLAKIRNNAENLVPQGLI